MGGLVVVTGTRAAVAGVRWLASHAERNPAGVPSEVLQAELGPSVPAYPESPSGVSTALYLTVKTTQSKENISTHAILIVVPRTEHLAEYLTSPDHNWAMCC
jgi:hypothetical protein